MGTTTDSGEDEAATIHHETDYLDAEVNILSPSTRFMRDHLQLIWIGFTAWALAVFGPVTATYFAPDLMTGATVLGFPLHYFLVAIGGPGGALLLSVLYSWRRDRLDEKYGIDHTSEPSTAAVNVGDTAVEADGGSVDDQATTEPGDGP